MSDLIAAPSIRRSLLADAVVSGAAGLVLLAGGGLAADLSGLPGPLLRGAGLALLPFAAAVLWLAKRPAPERRAVKAVIAVNLFWIVASLLLLVSGWVSPTSLGKLFVIAQALMVTGFAAAQAMALRRQALLADQPAMS